MELAGRWFCHCFRKTSQSQRTNAVSGTMSNFSPNYSDESHCSGSYLPKAFVSSQKCSDTQTKSGLDATIAQAMAELSFEERQRIQEDLHGVSEPIVEDRAQIDACLRDLDVHLNSMKKGSVYATAEMMGPFYVRDRDFRLSFLRSNRYNAESAARQMLNFFSIKLRLFGKEKLAKEITFSDLDDGDKQCLKTGCLQILPMTDSAGRQIVFHCPGVRPYNCVENELRARFYIFMCLWKSQETQKKGCVVVSYMLGRFQDKMNEAGFVERVILAVSFPLFLAGGHICTDHVAHCVHGKAAIGILPVSNRARFKLHLGSDQDLQDSLSTFGIPRQALPLDRRNYEPQFDGFLVWYNQQLCREDQPALQDASNCLLAPERQLAADSLLRPEKNDVLFVLGRRVSNAGNDHLRTLAQKRFEDYDLLSSKKKLLIAEEMINEIKRRGGRFLKQDTPGGLWKKVDEGEVCSKIMQMFRNIRYRRAIQDKSNSKSLRIASQIVKVVQVHLVDVLFGTTTCKNHPGNMRLREMVKDLGPEYDSATRARKTRLAELVVEKTKSMGGRFLIHQGAIDEDHWEMIPDDIARFKVTKLFRNVCRSTTTATSLVESRQNLELPTRKN
eukprot:scaffold6708_cov134-Cylindrotheca_fusiformis.AAC.8